MLCKTLSQKLKGSTKRKPTTFSRLQIKQDCWETAWSNMSRNKIPSTQLNFPREVVTDTEHHSCTVALKAPFGGNPTTSTLLPLLPQTQFCCNDDCKVCCHFPGQKLIMLQLRLLWKLNRFWCFFMIPLSLHHQHLYILLDFQRKALVLSDTGASHQPLNSASAKICHSAKE